MRKSAFPAQEFSGAGAVQAREAMDSIYGWQKHIYDLTRRPYLLGRDTIIRELEPAPGARVLEVGCGTARNLVSAARLWPQASFYGVDVSM
ncbi:MAG: class I SAM-dependent methyltransferase [Alphaproteobacteria bacterium]|nr:class I SAM-dependent methyltransferase [Alphaproteobacteria bacterium]